MSLRPKTRLGHYEIRSFLGKGGMGGEFNLQENAEAVLLERSL